jgi:hypothetical protein
MPQGEMLIGDFSGGCTLFVREAPNNRISDSDQDDFVRNRVTVPARPASVWRSGRRRASLTST